VVIFISFSFAAANTVSAISSVYIASFQPQTWQ